MRNDGNDKLGTVIVKRYATGTEDGELALVVGVCDAPSYALLTFRGAHYSWRQDLTRPATEEETVEYWRRRAEHAEERLGRLENPIDANSNSA